MSVPSLRPQSRAHKLAVFSVGAIAVGVGVVWLAFTFLRFGPLDIVNAFWDDYFAWGLDYRAYYDAAGRILSDGTPYARELVGTAFESGPVGLYYYSPALAVALLPVADISFADSSIWWFIAQMIALGGACLLMPVRALTRALAFAVVAITLPVFKDVAYGNVSTLLLLPSVMAWRWMDRPLGSVALAFAMAIRPSLGLLLIWQLLRRRWRAVAWTVSSGLVVVAITLPFVGIGSYSEYLAILGNLNVPAIEAGSDVGWENHDFGQVARSAGASVDVMGIVRLGSAAFAIGAMLLSLRRDREVSFMVTLMASMLVVPLLWDHYLTMLVIPAAFLAERWRPVAVLLPLLSWLPGIAAFTIALAMILPFFVRDGRTVGGASQNVAFGDSDRHKGLPRTADSV